MRKATLILAAVLTLTTGCGHTVAPTVAKAPASVPAAEPTTVATDAAAQEVASGGQQAPGNVQKPGDYVTYRFSGSFRKTPLTLTQRVVDVQGPKVTVDVTLKDGARSQALRAQFAGTPGGANLELIRVSRLDGTTERTVSNDAYDALMAKTMLAADRNEELVGTEAVDVTIAGRSIACTKTSYRVVVGKDKAIMSTLTSDAFAWGDLGGEIRRDDGRILYRAEVVDLGNDKPATDRVAQAE